MADIKGKMRFSSGKNLLNFIHAIRFKVYVECQFGGRFQGSFFS